MCRTKRDRPANKQQYREEIETKRDKGNHKHMDPYKRSKYKPNFYDDGDDF